MRIPAIPRWTFIVFALLAGCSTQVPTRTSSTQPTASILVASEPGAGATVTGPVNTLQLHFNPPARVDEVTITGPDGTMPMMVHSVGEVRDYSLPLEGLGPGNYKVDWKAFSGGAEHQGSFAFAVR